MAIFCKPKATHQGEQLVQIFTKLLSRDRPDEIQLGAAKWWVSIWSSNCLFVVSFTPSFLPSVFDVVFVSLCPPVSLSIFSSICLSLYPPACLSTKLRAYVPFLNSFFFLLVQSIFLSGCLSVCLLVSQSICPCNPFCLSGSLKFNLSFYQHVLNGIL